MPETVRDIPDEARKPKDTNAEAREARRADFDRLVPLAKNGDRRAWDGLARLVEPIILRECLRQGLSHDDALDVKQKVLTDLLTKKLKMYQEGNFEAWIKTIAHNESMSWHRGKKIKVKAAKTVLAGEVETGTRISPLPRFPETPEKQLLDAEAEHRARAELEDILAFVKRKNPAWAEIFRLHYIEGLSHFEVAAQLGIPTNTIHTSMARARAKIQAEYGIDLLEALGKTHLKRAA